MDPVVVVVSLTTCSTCPWQESVALERDGWRRGRVRVPALCWSAVCFRVRIRGVGGESFCAVCMAKLVKGTQLPVSRDGETFGSPWMYRPIELVGGVPTQVSETQGTHKQVGIDKFLRPIVELVFECN